MIYNPNDWNDEYKDNTGVNNEGFDSCFYYEETVMFNNDFKTLIQCIKLSRTPPDLFEMVGWKEAK